MKKVLSDFSKNNKIKSIEYRSHRAGMRIKDFTMWRIGLKKSAGYIKRSNGDINMYIGYSLSEYRDNELVEYSLDEFCALYPPLTNRPLRSWKI